jgi:hypothetical protein
MDGSASEKRRAISHEARGCHERRQDRRNLKNMREGILDRINMMIMIS